MIVLDAEVFVVLVLAGIGFVRMDRAWSEVFR